MMLKTATVFLASLIAISMASMHEKIEKFSEYAGVLERGISAKDGNQCFEKMACVLESSRSTTTGNGPLDSFRRVLTNSDNDFDEENFAELQKILTRYPHLEQLADSIQYAERFRSVDRCDAHYGACNVSAASFVESFADLDHYDDATGRQKRDVLSTACDVGSYTCLASTVGSVLCTLFTFGACGWSLATIGTCLAIDTCAVLTK